MLTSVAGRLVSLSRGGPPSNFSGFRGRAALLTPTMDFSTTSCQSNNLTDKYGPHKWLDYNKVVYPPQKPGEERRPAVSTRIGLERTESAGVMFTSVYVQSLFYIIVCVPSKTQHQVQSEKNVVRSVFRTRHVRRRSS